MFMNYIFLTNTNWNEPARIRHQLALLLKNSGNNIYFFERPIFKNLFFKAVLTKTNEITLVSNARLFHHRFSAGIFNKLDCLIMNRQLQKFIDENQLEPNSTVIINFIYDFSVRVKSLFKVYTFINDDFESQTAFLGLNYKRKYILNNIKSSGRLVTTSPFLTKKYDDVYCKNWTLLPWVTESEKKYIGKAIEGVYSDGDAVIFYGFVNNRLDFDLIEIVLSNLSHTNFEFYGQISSSVSRKVEYLSSKYKNINFRGVIKFCEIDFKSFFCSITPYGRHVSNIAVYVTNKLFRLAAAGLPSVNIGLSNLIEHPSVIKVSTYNEFITAIEYISKNKSFYRDESLSLAEQNDEAKALSQWNKILND